MITPAGDIPMAVLNVGITAVLPAIEANIGIMLSDLAALIPLPVLQAAFNLNPPTLPNPAALIAAGDNLVAYAQALNPATWVTAAANVNLDVVLELGLINAQIAVVAQAVAAIEAGVNTGGISTWCYSGPAPTPMRTLLDAGACQRYLRTQVIDAIIVATDADGVWDAFAAGFNDAGLRDSPGPRLTFSGGASAGNLLFALGRAFDVAYQFLLELGARKLQLEASLDLTLGLNLPAPPDIMLDVPFDLGSITANIDFDLMIGAVQLQIDAMLDLVADLEAQLSLGRLACWRFRGPAGNLGAEVAQAVGARFGGDVRAAVMTFAEPAAAASFATVFAVG